MKILITMYNINSPGGIINHNENLIAGLQNIGHEVNFVELVLTYLFFNFIEYFLFIVFCINHIKTF